ncbi:MAG TPA: M15 family metallopeptidase [Blastocatellia bacterium]|nr:M15 family metallopeptidase [Blastocatellia bacterium]
MRERSIIIYFIRFHLFLACVLCGRLELTMAGPDLNSGTTAELLRFDAAAQQNARLKTDLPWSFGGKSQRGWYLYSPLIGGLLGTVFDADSREFAQSLHRWQQASGLNATGILDHETWMLMVGRFQEQRLKREGRASARDLIPAPVSDFYDPLRPAELRMVEKQTYAAYQRLVAAANAELSTLVTNGPGSAGDSSSAYLKIISAFRSPAYQAQLRRRSPQAGRAGLALNSPHFTGRALDLYVGGDPVSTADPNRLIQVQTAAYRWLVRNAGRFGFYPYFYEPWHWEYRSSAGAR